MQTLEWKQFRMQREGRATVVAIGHHGDVLVLKNGADPRLQGLPGACHRGRQRILENIQVVGRPQQQLTKQLNAMSKPTPDSETIS
jgi:hypothetical protein